MRVTRVLVLYLCAALWRTSDESCTIQGVVVLLYQGVVALLYQGVVVLLYQGVVALLYQDTVLGTQGNEVAMSIIAAVQTVVSVVQRRIEIK